MTTMQKTENKFLRQAALACCFVVAFAFAKWRNFCGIATAHFSYADVYVVPAALFVVGVALYCFTGVAVQLFCTLPSATFLDKDRSALAVKLYLTFAFATEGTLRLLTFVFPSFLVWGNVLFPFAAHLTAQIALYVRVVKKHEIANLGKFTLTYCLVCLAELLLLGGVL